MSFLVSIKIALLISLFLVPLMTASAEPPRKLKRASLGQEFKLKVGERVVIKEAGLNITFSAVAEDSRCPEGVNCIWAGNGRIIVKVSKGRKKADVQLNTGAEPRQERFHEYDVKLVNLNPYPHKDTIPIKRGMYVATLVVNKASGPQSVPTATSDSISD
ncbi:MAG TPA: hypothetical protein VEQ40_06160 [Pyrinomonadaceae bacterium]|nr:hypothetical protein [Pyrinomonadaceae bacterium]